MFRLLLLRHSKALAQAEGGDIERALSQSGRDDALRLGQYLRNERLFPDLALTSRARRAQETLELALSGLGRVVAVIKKKRLYLAEPHTLLSVVRTTPPDIRTLLVVGHNPGLAAFANELSGSGDAQARAAIASSFPTTALAIIDFDLAGWDEVAFGIGTLERLVTPALLGGDDD
ncbi:MAG TPA: histidine phosphatase family protein [Beijerinckiaceae bacterium]|jgi:phosphohistidine phosphatase|nr:histidine phosphatase family protein [Beijerinckiaceae bacterium]